MQPFVQPQKRLSGKRLFSVISSIFVKLLYENPTHFSLRIQSSLCQGTFFCIIPIMKKKFCCKCLNLFVASNKLSELVRSYNRTILINFSTQKQRVETKLQTFYRCNQDATQNRNSDSNRGIMNFLFIVVTNSTILERKGVAVSVFCCRGIPPTMGDPTGFPTQVITIL